MKLNNYLFLSKTNLKNLKRKSTVLIMMILAVVAITFLAGLLNVMKGVMNTYHNSLRCRQIMILPERIYPEVTHKGVNENTINEILNIEHVISCEKNPYQDRELPQIEKITDENGNDITNSSREFNAELLTDGFYNQYADTNFSQKSIKGEQLKDSPVMGCIIPDFAYPYQQSKVDASGLLGKTLTLRLNYQIRYFEKTDTEGYSDNFENISEIIYELKVVGIYHYTNEGSVNGTPAILISPETALNIENMAIDKSRENNPNAYSDYTDDPCAREYIVTVDSYENAQDVKNKLSDLGYICWIMRGMDPSIISFANSFNTVGTFLLAAILALTVINLFLSVYSSINERRSEIGLMKAVGYKSSQTFMSMYLEYVILAVKALVAGTVISGIAALTLNAINSNSEILLYHSYVISLERFGVLTAVSFAVLLVVPLICLLIMTVLIAKIPPQEAMNS